MAVTKFDPSEALLHNRDCSKSRTATLEGLASKARADGDAKMNPSKFLELVCSLSVSGWYYPW